MRCDCGELVENEDVGTVKVGGNVIVKCDDDDDDGDGDDDNGVDINIKSIMQLDLDHDFDQSNFWSKSSHIISIL